MSNQGIFVPLITPLDCEGGVCPLSVERLANACRDNVEGFIACLTSGEGWRLDDRNWEAMVRATVANAGGRKVIAGLERPTTGQVVTLARRAETLGVDAIMLTTPFGQRVSQQAMVDHYGEIHDATRCDLFVYNESALSGNETDLATLLSIAELPRVVGIKDSPAQPRTVAEVEALQARGLAYYIGWEERLASGLPSDGNVVSLANLEPALCRLAVSCEAPALQAEIRRLSSVYQLDAEDWYRHVKVRLQQRGVIVTDRLVSTGREEAVA